MSAENRKANLKHEQPQFSVSYRSAQPRQHITLELPYIAHNPQLARQHCRTDPPCTASRRTSSTGQQPRRSRAFFPRPSRQSEDNSRKIQHGTLKYEVGSPVSVQVKKGVLGTLRTEAYRRYIPPILLGPDTSVSSVHPVYRYRALR